MTLGDRIVVMKDGFIQQGSARRARCSIIRPTCSSPASSARPQMNFFDAKLVRSGNAYAVALDGHNVALPGQRLQNTGGRGAGRAWT